MENQEKHYLKKVTKEMMKDKKGKFARKLVRQAAKKAIKQVKSYRGEK